MHGADTELPGTSGTAWSNEEQLSLEQLLCQYPAAQHATATERYVLIASGLPGKTARDVALRVKWMSMQPALGLDVAGGQRKRRPEAEHAKAGSKASPAKHSALRNAHSMPPLAASRPGSSGDLAGLGGLGVNSGAWDALGTSFPPQLQLPSNSSGNAGTDVSGQQGSDGAAHGGGANGSGSSVATPLNGLLGHTGPPTPPLPPLPPPLPVPEPGTIPNDEALDLLSSLMEQNCTLLAHIRSNMSHCKVVENIDLLSKYRDNLSAAVWHISSMQGVMQQLPPLPVQPNWELAGRVLPPSPVPVAGPGVMPPAPGMPLMPMPGPIPSGVMLGPSMPMMSPPGMMPGGMMGPPPFAPAQGYGPAPGPLPPYPFMGCAPPPYGPPPGDPSMPGGMLPPPGGPMPPPPYPYGPAGFGPGPAGQGMGPPMFPGMPGMPMMPPFMPMMPLPLPGPQQPGIAMPLPPTGA